MVPAWRYFVHKFIPLGSRILSYLALDLIYDRGMYFLVPYLKEVLKQPGLSQNSYFL